MIKLCEVAVIPLIVLSGGLLESFFEHPILYTAPHFIHRSIFYDHARVHGSGNKRIAPHDFAESHRAKAEYSQGDYTT